jgi:hypothetical protein
MAETSKVQKVKISGSLNACLAEEEKQSALRTRLVTRSKHSVSPQIKKTNSKA